MTPFELVEPETLQEAVALLDPEKAGVRAVGGGTALLLMMKARLFRPSRLVGLRRVSGAPRAIEAGPGGVLRIGALASLGDLERSPLVAARAPMLAPALRKLANVRVRNVATLGGHLAHGDPHMDLPPILLTLAARIRTLSPRGERWIDMADLIVGYYQTTLSRDELIADVFIPTQPVGVSAWYEKFSALNADDWPTVGVAVWYRLESGVVAEARIAVGAATERPGRTARAEAVLVGAPASTTTFAEAADAAATEIEPIADIRGSAPYKREMIRVHVRRALEHALGAQRGEES